MTLNKFVIVIVMCQKCSRMYQRHVHLFYKLTAQHVPLVSKMTLDAVELLCKEYDELGHRQ